MKDPKGVRICTLLFISTKPDRGSTTRPQPVSRPVEPPGNCRVIHIDDTHFGKHDWRVRESGLRSQRERDRLRGVAEDEVRAIVSALPNELGERARDVPVIYELRPNLALCREGIESDTLGLFVGLEFPNADSGTPDLPAQIILFIENVWDFAGRNLRKYRREVRRTYLHELGHYLGLDEEDLTKRHLD